jgi:hypothetical protein
MIHLIQCKNLYKCHNVLLLITTIKEKKKRKEKKDLIGIIIPLSRTTLGVVAHTYNPISLEAEAGGYSKFEACLGYTERLCLPKKRGSTFKR